MADLKSELVGLKMKNNPPESTKSSFVEGDDRGLTTYEEFIRATRLLKEEKSIPLKNRDMAKALRLEKLVQRIQSDLQEEVTAYRQLYPEISHEELSQRALDLRIEKQQREAREIHDRQIRWEEVERRKAELALIRQHEEDALEELAANVVQRFSLVTCVACKDGSEKSICEICKGTGRIAPYVRLVSKLVIGCCHRPTCTICAGTNMYYRDQWETSTECSSNGCIAGSVLIPCSTCHGTQFSSSDGEPLSLDIASDYTLVDRIKKIIAIA